MHVNFDPELADDEGNSFNFDDNLRLIGIYGHVNQEGKILRIGPIGLDEKCEKTTVIKEPEDDIPWDMCNPPKSLGWHNVVKEDAHHNHVKEKHDFHCFDDCLANGGRML